MRKLKEHVPLSGLTTMRVGGPARYFYVAKNIQQIKDILLFVENKKIPVFVLGSGSNIVVGDKGFKGLVLKMDIKGIEIKESGDAYVASVGAGEEWDAFVEKIVSKNIFSIENLSSIPGTVGGAPVQNIGAYGVEIKDFISSVEVLHVKNKRVEHLSRDECAFGYRDSIFKQTGGKDLIITRVVFRFPQKREMCVHYKDIDEYIIANDLKKSARTPVGIREIITTIRKRKLPDTRDMGTVGSFFKNPIISKEKFLALSHIYRGLPGYETEDSLVKVPLGWIIEHVCKKKGFRKNGVGVYEKQALVVVNYGESTAAEIKQFAEDIRDDIKRHTGIEVEFEISFVGEF